MKKKYNIQTKQGHYDGEYDQLPRWISYYLQINSIRQTTPRKILEIGLGNGLVADYFKKQGIDYTTCDFDKRLNPDVVADIRKLPLKNNSFDFILACEILEHLHYSEFENILKELKRVTSKYVLLSLPSPGLYFQINLRFNGLKKIFSKELLSLGLSIPPFLKNSKFDGEHYWEIGQKKHSLRRVRKDILKYFKIEKEFKNPIAPIHKFFLLKIK